MSAPSQPREVAPPAPASPRPLASAPPPSESAPTLDAPLRGPTTPLSTAVPDADTAGAWLRSRPPIHGTPVVTDPAATSARGEAPRKRSLIRPQTRPPSVRAPLPSPLPSPVPSPVPSPSLAPLATPTRESQAQQAYGRTLADRRATPAEIDASVRRTSAPPPMMRPPIHDARTERMSQPPRIERAPPAPIFDDAAATHLDLPVVPPEFIASMLADRGSGDLIADLDLTALDGARPGRPLARPPRPAVPDELRAMADPTIDEALLDLAPTEEVTVELGPDVDADQAGFSSTLAGAAWLEPEHGLATPDARPLRPPIAPPSAWTEPPTVDHFSRTPPRGTTPRGPSLSGVPDPTLRDLPRASPGRLPAATAISSPGAAGATGRPRSGVGPPARSNSGPSPSRLAGASGAPRPPPSGSGDITARGASLPPRDDSGQIRRVDDPSLDEIIQGYLDTKRRR